MFLGHSPSLSPRCLRHRKQLKIGTPRKTGVTLSGSFILEKRLGMKRKSTNTIFDAIKAPCHEYEKISSNDVGYQTRLFVHINVFNYRRELYFKLHAMSDVPGPLVSRLLATIPQVHAPSVCSPMKQISFSDVCARGGAGMYDASALQRTSFPLSLE